MNIERLKQSLGLLAIDGYRPTHQESALIEHSLVVLQKDNKFEQVYWWGRVSGLEANYFIAFGYRRNIVFNKKYFYSLNCSDWYLMPPAKVEFLDASRWCNERFLGDPTHIEVMDDAVHLKEEDRLACVVQLITEEAGLVPRGSFYRRSDHEIVQSPVFRGLPREDALSFTNYQLFRPPRNLLNHNLLKRPHYNYRTDFFDTLDDIFPVNRSFSIHQDANKLVVIIRSLHWPGMVFFHQLNTPLHGFRYLGDGICNKDILFMT